MHHALPNCRHLVIAFLAITLGWLTPGALEAQVSAVIDFEDLPAGTVPSTVDGDAGGTPIGPIGLNGMLSSDPGNNRALIFDSSNPTGGDFDLGSPNQDFGGPGVGPAGEMGGAWPNSYALGKIMIMAEDLVDTSPADGLVDDPDDAAENDMIFDFDFTTITSPFVPEDITIFEITTIDGEDAEAPGMLRLYDENDTLIASIDLNDTGCNGVRTHLVGAPGVGISGVARAEVELDGSGGFDGFVFEATPPLSNPVCTMDPVGTPVPGGHEYNIEVGETITITVCGETFIYDGTVILSGDSLPAGSTTSPMLPLDSTPDSSVCSTWSWTPTAADIGTHTFWFKVMDNYGQESVCDPIINVTCELTIDTHPSDSTVCEGDSATFSVSASGSAPISYQWRKNGTAIPGASSASFTIASTTTGDAGSYDVVVSNPCETLTSNPATLTVQTAPTVSDPAGQTACEGDDVSFSVTVTGDPTPSVQWQKDGSDIPGATSTTLSLNSIDVGDAGSYVAVVTNACGTDSSRPAVLTVETAPVITQVTVNTTEPCEGTALSFTVTASGSAPLTIQWRRNGVAIPGANGAMFTIAAVAPGDAGTYDVTVTNNCDTATSVATPIVVRVAPAITAQPMSDTVCEGDSATFMVTASGTAPITYQWRFNGMPIGGATGASYSIPSAATGDAGSYDVVVSNDCGSATSDAAVLTVRTAPTIDTHPMGDTICEGESITFTSSASGSAPLTFQWFKDGAAIPGATSASYSIGSATPADNGSYTVTVSNDCGNDTSAAAVLTVRTGPAITAQPSGDTVCEGDAASFSVTATGSAPLSYQWFKDGVAIPGANSASFMIASANSADAGSYTVNVSNDCGDVTSSAAVLTVDTAPAITSQPMSSTNCEGESVTFSVSATGTAPLTYQWFLDGAAIPGATSDSYMIAAVSGADAGTYTVVVSNACGDATSNGATLTVEVAPSITAQPMSQMVCEGDAVSFSVTATGTAPLTYQWFKDGVAIPGANGDSYSIASAGTGDAGGYSVTVTNNCDTATSNTAALTVDTAPAITSQPMSQTSCEGDAVTFSVTATGSSPLTYQWFKDGVAIPGANGDSYMIVASSGADAGTYTVVVSNVCGDATSNGAALTVEVAPSITAQPMSQTACEGDMISFAVTATGTAPFTYQWLKDGVAIPGANGDTYTIALAGAGDAGSYQVEVTNNCGTATSNTATLTVDTAPAITSQPMSQTSCEGDAVTFSVTATGSAPLTYQWFKDGMAIPGANGDSYMIVAAAGADAGTYTVVVSNVCGDATSNGATLTVEVAPSITVQPMSQTVCEGDMVTFSAGATGTTPFNYQWLKDGVAIPGANGDTYTIAAAGPGDAGNYQLEVSNNCGTATSNTATLTVDTAPTITTQPMSQTACEGEMASFSVMATGSAPLTYQWFQDGVAIPGATGDTLTIPSLASGDAGSYTVTVSNVCGDATSNAAVLTVDTPPSITAQPTAQVVCEGESVTFSVTASGTTPLNYQWFMDGVAIPGATGDSYTIAAAMLADGGNYTVTVSNSCADVTSDPAALTVRTGPSITADPQSDSACEGDMVSFTITASGNPPLTVQWFKDGVAIPGATGTTLTIASASAADAGSYTAEVTNDCGTATSAAADLEVLTPPSVTDPADVTVCEGDGVNLMVTATGSPVLTFQWRKDGVDIPGANTDTFTIASAVPADAGSYDVVVTNDCGTATSNTATVVVNETPTIDVQPIGGMFAVGDDVTLMVTASGTPPLAYQWRRDGVDIPGANTDTYTIMDIQLADEGAYDVVVSNVCGEATSNLAVVEVDEPDPDGFVRGDCNIDGIVNLADAVKIMRFTFQGFPLSDCMSACDHNDDGVVDIADVIFLLQYIFLEGPEPFAPFGACSPDPTPDTLPCTGFDACDID